MLISVFLLVSPRNFHQSRQTHTHTHRDHVLRVHFCYENTHTHIALDFCCVITRKAMQRKYTKTNAVVVFSFLNTANIKIVGNQKQMNLKILTAAFSSSHIQILFSVLLKCKTLTTNFFTPKKPQTFFLDDTNSILKANQQNRSKIYFSLLIHVPRIITHTAMIQIYETLESLMNVVYKGRRKRRFVSNHNVCIL